MRNVSHRCSSEKGRCEQACSFVRPLPAFTRIARKASFGSQSRKVGSSLCQRHLLLIGPSELRELMAPDFLHPIRLDFTAKSLTQGKKNSGGRRIAASTFPLYAQRQLLLSTHAYRIAANAPMRACCLVSSAAAGGGAFSYYLGRRTRHHLGASITPPHRQASERSQRKNAGPDPCPQSSGGASFDPFQQAAQFHIRIHFGRVSRRQIQTACKCRAMSGYEFGDVAPIHANPQLETRTRARFGLVNLKAVVVAHLPIQRWPDLILSGDAPPPN